MPGTSSSPLRTARLTPSSPRTCNPGSPTGARGPARSSGMARTRCSDSPRRCSTRAARRRSRKMRARIHADGSRKGLRGRSPDQDRPAGHGGGVAGPPARREGGDHRHRRDHQGRHRAPAPRGQLRQSQKMEAVGRLAGGVAHDFNNLLTVIIGLQRAHPGQPATGATRCAARSRRFGKPAERAAAPDPPAPGLQPQAGAAAEGPRPQRRRRRAWSSMLRRLIGEDIELRTHPRPPASAWCKADPGQLEQVIMNLAVNARDAMPQRRQAHHRDRATSSSTRPTRSLHPARRPGPLRHAGGERHRRRHGRGDAARASSSRSSPPRRPARAPAWAWPRSTASSSRAAATSGSTASRAWARTFKIYLPAPDGRGRSRQRRPAAEPPAAGQRDGPAGRGRGEAARAGPASRSSRTATRCWRRGTAARRS